MIELVISDILCKASDGRAYVMLLKERDGERKIIAAIGHSEAQAIALAMRNVETPRPMTHDLILNVVGALGANMQHVYIYKVEDGTFYARMLLETAEGNLREVDARTSDAVAVAIRCDVPILIDEELLNRVCVREEFKGAFSLPIAVADTDTLRRYMELAVKEENYELAQKIKMEIDTRHNASDEYEDVI